ncbi:MAG: hypothetical protein R2705_14020 [Ilumatobacteraceae bacterium]
MLRFSFGTMGSGKSTLALQIRHNVTHRGLRCLLLTKLDRDGSQVTSRLGVVTCGRVSEGLDLFELVRTSGELECVVCDEAQFYSAEQCDQLARVVDGSASTCSPSASSPTPASSSTARSDCSRSPTSGS